MENDIELLLTKAKELLKEEMSQISYNTWIEPLRIDSIKDNNIVLIEHDPFKKDYVESRYKSLIANTFNVVLQMHCTVTFISDTENNECISSVMPQKTSSTINNLLPEYTFSTFVVGDNNRFAHAASLAVAEAPATAYNPLFLYGSSGLGKTHLMHAIGNEVCNNNKDLKVLYVDSEKFFNAFINALKENSVEVFREKYRNIDVLLIDDIQFIAGKERLQEEIFHTFNTLHNSRKQIILSSDRPPRDIPQLEERLKSRFEWGLLADVSMADYETRLAILRKKADEKKTIIDDDILSNIAAKIDSNIRELEGILKKLVGISKLMGAPITMEMSEKAINDVIRQKESVISVEYIQETVCKYFNVTTEAIIGAHRSNDIAFPRQIGMYLCRILTNASFPQIGDAFGKRDHTTVMHAFKKIEKEIKENSNTKLIVESVKKLILNKE